MTKAARFLSPAEAGKALGVSPKALRLYEERGLIDPGRTEAGWRVYGPEDMTRATEIVALRSLGFSLGQIARLQAGDTDGIEGILATHQRTLEEKGRGLAETVRRIRDLRRALGDGATPAAGDLVRLLSPEKSEAADPAVAFDLPWPWGGERFELRALKPIIHIVGPLFSGKTRLAQRLAADLPGARFLGLDRLGSSGGAEVALPAPGSGWWDRIESALAWMVEDGATRSDALTVLVGHLEEPASGPLVVDMIEQGLDEATQMALIAHLRRRGSDATPVMMLTRSTAILDLAAVGPDEAVLFCPANHSPPFLVPPRPGAPGYEAVESCLASPEVRARSEGVVAVRR
ncbi:MAG: MerR family transcriptional regulator [Alphaproteobacteria bacterium]|nr:MerR family transcriptional regulator [Alphaproteobacteria bacterium]